MAERLRGDRDMQNATEMREIMRYIGWMMFNGFDNEEQRAVEDRIPINGTQATAKNGVQLLIQGFEREERDWV